MSVLTNRVACGFAFAFFAISSIAGCGNDSTPTVIEQPPGLTDYEKSQMTPEEIDAEMADRAAKASQRTP